MYKPEITIEPKVIDLNGLKDGVTIEFSAFAGNRILHTRLIGGVLPMAETAIRSNSCFWYPGAITALYEFADKIREAVEIIDLHMTYKFTTEHPKMRMWALDPQKGYRIFDWDAVQVFWREEDKTKLRKFNAWKRFFPKSAGEVLIPREQWGLMKTKEDALAFNKWLGISS